MCLYFLHQPHLLLFRIEFFGLFEAIELVLLHVLARKVEERTLSAHLRHHLFGISLGKFHEEGQYNLGRSRRKALAHLHNAQGEQRIVGFIELLLEFEGERLRDGSVDHVQEVDKRDFLVAFDGENIDIIAHIRHYLRFCAEVLHQIILLFQRRRLLKSELFSKRRHLFAQFLRHFARVSFENFATGFDVAQVVLVRLFAEYAGTGAFADVVIQAQVVFPRFHPFFRHRLVARPRMVEALAEIQEGIHGRQVAVRPVIGGTAAFAVARFENTGEILVRDGNIRIGLVVFEQYIVARLVLLDERIFEQEGIFLRIHDGVGDVSDLRNEQCRLSALLLLVEVRRNATLQVFGLSDVDNRPFVVIILVAPRLLGEVLHDAFEVRFECLAFFFCHVRGSRVVVPVGGGNAWGGAMKTGRVVARRRNTSRYLGGG